MPYVFKGTCMHVQTHTIKYRCIHIQLNIIKINLKKRFIKFLNLIKIDPSDDALGMKSAT